jgi:hypothetical protein
MCRATCLLVTLLILISLTAHGSDAPPPLDPSVVEIRTAGWWEEAGQGGTYRVVVRHTGVEHINTSVQVEWLMQADAYPTERVVHSIRLLDTLLGAVTIESMKGTKDGVKLVLAGPMQYGPDYHCVIALRPGGSYTKIAGCLSGRI